MAPTTPPAGDPADAATAAIPTPPVPPKPAVPPTPTVTVTTAKLTEPPSIGSLVSSATADLSALVRAEVELAKAEISTAANRAAKASALLVGAAILGYLAFVFLLVTAAYGLIAAGLSPWLAFLIVAAVLLLVTAILALVGVKRLKTVQGPVRTQRTVEETKAYLSSRGGRR